MFKKVTLAIAVILVTMFAVTVANVHAATDSHNPAGNNGTVKINDELAPDSIPNNHPHVSCTFSVDFYNYDKGDYNATVDFELQPPTAGNNHSLTVTTGNLHPFIGGDGAGGGKDLDASEKYTLAFTGSAHPQQGYHVKLTITAPGSQGSDKKHKVFWVKPCAASSSKPTGHVLGESGTAAQPTELPNTGPGDVLGIFAATTIAGAIAHRLFLSRRLSAK